MTPIWLSVMEMVIGLKEIPGPKNEPIIMKWASDIGAPKWYDDDDKPWCAIGMNRILLACQLPMARSKTKPDRFDLLRAATFKEYGIALPEPTLGCIMTFSRPSGDHVGLYLGESKDAFYILGANQKNMIAKTWILKERLTSIRWPSDIPITATGRIVLNMSGIPTTNEE